MTTGRRQSQKLCYSCWGHILLFYTVLLFSLLHWCMRALSHHHNMTSSFSSLSKSNVCHNYSWITLDFQSHLISFCSSIFSYYWFYVIHFFIDVLLVQSLRWYLYYVHCFSGLWEILEEQILKTDVIINILLSEEWTKLNLLTQGSVGRQNMHSKLCKGTQTIYPSKSEVCNFITLHTAVIHYVP